MCDRNLSEMIRSGSQSKGNQRLDHFLYSFAHQPVAQAHFQADGIKTSQSPGGKLGFYALGSRANQQLF